MQASEQRGRKCRRHVPPHRQGCAGFSAEGAKRRTLPQLPPALSRHCATSLCMPRPPLRSPFPPLPSSHPLGCSLLSLPALFAALDVEGSHGLPQTPNSSFQHPQSSLPRRRLSRKRCGLHLPMPLPPTPPCHACSPLRLAPRPALSAACSPAPVPAGSLPSPCRIIDPPRPTHCPESSILSSLHSQQCTEPTQTDDATTEGVHIGNPSP